MSFILDALRRAERERKAGTPPDVGAVIGPIPTPLHRPRRPWLLLIGTGALGGLLVALVWIGGQQEAAPPQQQEIEARGDAAPPARDPSAAAQRAPDAVSRQLSRTAQPMDVSSRRPAPAPVRHGPGTSQRIPPASVSARELQSTQTVPAENHQGPTETIEQGQTAEAPQQRLARQSEVIAPSPWSAETASAGSDGVEEQASSPPAPPPTLPQRREPLQTRDLPQQVAAGDGDGGMPIGSPEPATSLPAVPVGNLPEDQKRAFEGVRLDAHVYSEQARDRFVLIRMRIHRIGDEVGDKGLIVEDITPEGAVLRNGSTRALVPHP